MVRASSCHHDGGERGRLNSLIRRAEYRRRIRRFGVCEGLAAGVEGAAGGRPGSMKRHSRG